MKLDVRFFAHAREMAGTELAEVEVLPSNGDATTPTVADLRTALTARFPVLVPLIPNLLIAVGTEYADDETQIVLGDEVACFPPVSGG